MGYHATSILLYGIELTSNQAAILEDVLYKYIEDEDVYFEEICSRLKLHDVTMLGEGADSRVHKLSGFDDENYGTQYVIGVELGDDSKDNVKIIAKGTTQAMKDSYEKLLPYLKEAGIKKVKPDFHFVNQTH